MSKLTPLKLVLFRRTLRTLLAGVLSAAAILYGGFVLHAQTVYAAAPSTLNFQARLETISGAVAPDGVYNVQFKLYDASSGGTNMWTETRLVNSGQGVTVSNGYLTVNLGDINAFTNASPAINWDQQLYLTLNVGGTANTPTPSWDGEMSPRLKLTGVPYAFQAQSAEQLHYTQGSYSSTLSFLQPTGGDQTFQIADQGAAGTYTLLTQNAGDGRYIQNAPAGQQTANFNIVSPAAGTIGALIQGAASATQPVMVVKGGATPASGGDLLQLQDSSANILDKFDANGYLTVKTSPSSNFNYTTIQPGKLIIQNNGGNVINTFTARSNDSLLLDGGTGNFRGFTVGSDNVTTNANLMLQNTAGSNDLLAFKDINGNPLAKFDVHGQFAAYGTNTQLLGLMTPSISSVTNTGTAGSTTYGYQVTALNAQGETTASTEATTTTGNATLSVSNYNVIHWNSVNGATSYKVYGRTAGGELYMATVTATGAAGYSYNDTGAATPSGALPSNPTGTLVTLQAWNGQTGNLLQLQDSSGAVLDRIDSSGRLLTGGLSYSADLASINTPGINVGYKGNGGGGGSGNAILHVSMDGSASGEYIQTYGNSPNGYNAFAINTNNGQTLLSAGSTNATLQLRDYSGQTANILQLQDANANTLTNFDTNGQLTSYGTNTQLLGLATPAISSVTNSGTAGSTTYGYQVSALNSQGETLASTQVTTATGNATLSGSNYNVVQWNGVNGATSYKVYGRTAGSELYMATVTSTGAGSYSYNDTGAATPSGALPSSPAGTALTLQGWSGQTGNLLQLQNASGAVVSKFDASGNLQVGSSIDTVTATTLSLGTTNATAINLNQNTTVASGKTLTVNGTALFKNSANSTTALQIQNSAGTQLLNVDTTANAANLVTNGSFEQNTTGFNPKGSGVLSRITSQQLYGSASLEVDMTAAGDGTSYPITLTAGQQYTVSVYVKSATSNFSTFQMGYAADGSNETAYNMASSTPGTSGWSRFSYSFTPASVSGSPYLFFKQNTSGSRTMYLDGIQLETGANSSPYHEGTFTLQGSLSTPLSVYNPNDSSTAFQVVDSGGGSVFGVNTMLDRVYIGNVSPTSNQLTSRLYVVAGGMPNLRLNQSGSSNLLEMANNNTNVALFDQNGNLQAPSLDSLSGTLTIGSSNATAINIGKTASNITTTVTGLFVAQPSTGNDSATAFVIQNAARAKLFVVDSAAGAIKIGGGDVSPNGTPVLLVLDNKSTSGDPAGVEGAMYYNSSEKLMRCYRDGIWQDCATSQIDHSWVLEDDFISASTNTSGAFGAAGWILNTIGSAVTPRWNGSAVNFKASADHPGTLEFATASTINTGGVLSASGSSNQGSIMLAAGDVVKTTVGVGSATSGSQTLRIGLHNEISATSEPTSGIWWEADPTQSANWRYCYGDGSVSHCAASTVAISAAAWARLSIQITATGSGTSAATFIGNGTSFTVSSVTIDSATGVTPNFVCFTQQAATNYCGIDYFQAQGVTSAAR